MGIVKRIYMKKHGQEPKNSLKWIIHPKHVKKLLLITNEEEKSLKRKCEELFQNAAVHHLFERPIKIDNSKGFYYTVHESDFNLTGKLKNDKLTNLAQMEFDLLIDLSQNSETLDFFLKKVKSGLKVGDLSTENKNNYDFFVELNNRDVSTITLIHKQLAYLTKDE